jgi:hypothetical protein
MPQPPPALSCSRLSYYLLLALTFALLAVPRCVAQQPKVLAPHKPVAPRLPQPKSWHKPAAPQSLIGGLWMIDPNLKSSVYLKNDLKTSPLSVTPVLWLSNGVKYSLPVVNLDPSGTAIVDINQSLAAQGVAPYATLMGYVEFDYQWPWPALCATIRNIDPVHSVIFTYFPQLALPVLAHPHANPSVQNAPQAQPDSQLQPQTQILEGLWWKQEPNVSGFVALSNPGAQAVVANLGISDARGNPIGQHTVAVSPHGTKMVTLDELPSVTGASGGLRLTYAGPENGLLVSAGLRDDASGYSANIPFAPSSAPAETVSTTTYAELGLMTGAADPMLSFPAGTTFKPYTVVRNVSNQPAVITPNLWWMMGGAPGNATLPRITVAPYQSLNLDLASYLAQAGLKNFNGSVNLVLEVTSGFPRGAVLISSGSVDQRNTYVFQIAPEGIRESMAKNLSYWSTANGDDTMVTVWNPADEAQDFVFTFFYSGGQYLHPIHLEPRATLMFNVSEIIHNQLPDSEGNVIPLGVHDGSAEISGPHGENEYILVAMDAGTYNVQKATCNNNCKTCQGAVDSWITDNPFSVAVGGTHQLAFTVQSHSGIQYNITTASTWSSSNNSVATVGSTTGSVTGVAAGTMAAAAVDDGYPLYDTGCFGFQTPPPCPWESGVSGEGGGDVQVPEYFFSPSAVQTTTPPLCVQEGGVGYFLDVSYYVADASSARISQSGMTPGENLNDGKGWHDDFATPQTTTSSGSFHDTPNGSCYITQGHFCAAAPPQSFRVTDGNIVSSIATNTTRRTCTDGITLVIQGNPSGQNQTYTFGNVQ